MFDKNVLSSTTLLTFLFIFIFLIFTRWGKKMKCKKTTSLVTNNLDGDINVHTKWPDNPSNSSRDILFRVINISLLVALGWKKNRITKGLKMCYYSVMWRASRIKTQGRWFNPPAHLALYVHLLGGGPGKGNLECKFQGPGLPLLLFFFLTEFPKGTQPRDK